MKLFFTPLSHFSRKVRILIEAYGLSCEYINIKNVAQNDPLQFGDNPLMGVPVLEDEGAWLIDSNHIAYYLTKKYDPNDPFNVLSNDILDLNIRAVLDGMMGNEVKLILGARTGIAVDEFFYFQKAKKAIHNSLKWLAERHSSFSRAKLSFREIHLICALKHLQKYGLVEVQEYPDLYAIVSRWDMDPRIEPSDPKHFEIYRPKN